MILLMLFSMISQAAVPDDPIQRCLMVRRLADLTTRQKMEAKEPGVLRFKFHKVSSDELPLDNPKGNMSEVISALNNQIKNCKRARGKFQTITIAGREVTRKTWCLETSQKMLKLAKAADGDFKKYLSSLKTAFDWYKSEGWPEKHAGFKKGEFQFTAYYAPPAYEAKSKKAGTFLYPLYANPGLVGAAAEAKRRHVAMPLCGVDPLSKIAHSVCLKHDNGTYTIPPDREEIAHGALDPKYIIGYLSNPNDPAFLMLQGAGSFRLDGTLFQLNYDGSNGRPRTMLGRIVQCSLDPSCGGNLDTMERCAKDPNCHSAAKLRCKLSKAVEHAGASETLIRKYLDGLSQAKADDLRNRDQSYVFFAKEAGGPFGAENIPLTPHASCATDHRVIPVGMSFIYHTKKLTSWCVAQDAGGAIIGAHVDLYKGEGHKASSEANKFNNPGSLFVALPKGD